MDLLIYNGSIVSTQNGSKLVFTSTEPEPGTYYYIQNLIGTTGAGSTNLGQTWLQTESGTVKGISANFTGSLSVSATLNIYNLDTSTLIDTYSVTIINGDWLEFDVDFDVISGTNYYFYLISQSTSINVSINSENPYTNGYMIFGGSELSGYDLEFKIKYIL